MINLSNKSKPQKALNQPRLQWPAQRLTSQERPQHPSKGKFSAQSLKTYKMSSGLNNFIVSKFCSFIDRRRHARFISPVNCYSLLIFQSSVEAKNGQSIVDPPLDQHPSNWWVQISDKLQRNIHYMLASFITHLVTYCMILIIADILLIMMFARYCVYYYYKIW